MMFAAAESIEPWEYQKSDIADVLMGKLVKCVDEFGAGEKGGVGVGSVCSVEIGKMRICEKCKQEKPEVRLDMQEGCFGPVASPICAECYAQDVAERRAEGRKFGYRPRIVPWQKLDVCNG